MRSVPSATLFEPARLGTLDLPNRVVMASMTRGRAENVGLVPTPLQAQYYRQRAAAGLIISEAAWISSRAIGSVYANVPGAFTPEQTVGWGTVADAVHDAGGRIFMQLAHAGAVSHPDLHGGSLPLGPSAINPALTSLTSEGLKHTVTPRAMTVDDIRATVDEYAAAARNAKAAGFDGVELHCGNTYLLPEFLNSALNQRTDSYGASAAGRSRIVFEVLDAMIAQWGAGRVGIKIGPTFAMGGFQPTGKTQSTYDHLVDGLNDLPLSHLQVVRARGDISATAVAALQDTVAYYRGRYRGTLIGNGGFGADTADDVIRSKGADLVSFARHFVGNPDLTTRLRDGLPLSPSDSETWYEGGARGYVDYATAMPEGAICG
jgi:N-ethylmaleimide reductase